MRSLHKNMRLILLLIIIFPSVIVLQSIAAQFKCIRVYDGDTIKVTGDGNEITVRLVGIDAPETSKQKHEPGQPFSRKSTKYLPSLVLNKSVDVKSFGTDRYGRTLGVVFVDGKNANLEMVKAGLAEVYRVKPAAGLNLDPYWKAESEAKKSKRGMWSLGDKYVSPREWRKRNR